MNTIIGYIKSNKRIAVIVGGCLAAFIVILCIVSGIHSSKKNNSVDLPKTDSTTQRVSATVNETTTSTQATTAETTTKATSRFLKEDTVSGTVYQNSTKEYYIKAESDGVHRFSATERTANCNVYIKVFDMNENRIMSETNEGACTLERNGEYKITIDTDSSSCSYKLEINRPHPVKNITADANTVHDSITFVSQCNVYTFTAGVSGRYRVDCLNRTDGYNLEIAIYNSNNERVFRETNGGYLDLQTGVVYTIQVQYSTGFCEYDLVLSIPNEVKELAATDSQTEDSLTFANQINKYTYSPEISGKYRFETRDRTNGYNVRIRICDANNNRILNETNNGTVSLEKGSKYVIQVEYDSDLCSYTLFIGIPNEIKNISTGENVSDSISFVDQENRYTITPSATREYKVTASGRTSDYNVRIYVYDANDNRILNENNEGTVELKAGTLYTIYVCFVDNLCSYTLSVS